MSNKKYKKYFNIFMIAYIPLSLLIIGSLVFNWKYDKSRINEDQAQKIGYGEALKRCLNNTKNTDTCNGMILSSEKRAGENHINVWEFHYFSEQSGGFNTSVYVDSYGKIVSMQDIVDSLSN